nr:hypothetical protein [Tanacetum cinerariifolium]
MMIYLRNIASFKMDYFKGMKYDDIHPIFEKYFNSNLAFLVKTKEQMEEEDSKALKRISGSQEDKAAKGVVNGVVQAIAPTTTEQRLAKKNELKAIEKRFGGNKETKKVHKTLLKQRYENFSDSISKSLDQIHDRLQKLISQLEILGESLSREYINLKFLRSLPSEWRTHTLIWRNKADLEDQSLDDLFNNLNIKLSTNESVSVVPSVYATSTKPPASIHPNVDNL